MQNFLDRIKATANVFSDIDGGRKRAAASLGAGALGLTLGSLKGIELAGKIDISDSMGIVPERGLDVLAIAGSGTIGAAVAFVAVELLVLGRS